MRVVARKEWIPIRMSRQSPKISHIFFADNLLLFGEASFSQERKMEFLLVQFCGQSGQRFNRAKSRVWFSPNTPGYLRHSICLEFKVIATTNLETYLGVPLFHKRPTKLYHDIIEKA